MRRIDTRIDKRLDRFIGRGTPVQSSAAGFTPIDISGLVLDINPAAISGLNDGDAVASFTESGPNGYTVAQSTSGNRPVYKTAILNSKAVLRFTAASSHYLTIADANPLDLQAPFTIITVVASASTAAGFARILGKGSAYSFGRNGGLYRFTTPGRKDYDSTASWFEANVFKIHAVTMNSSFGAAFYTQNIQAGQTVSGTQQAATSSSALDIGRGAAGSEYWGGDIARILIYSKDLSATERRQVHTYLASQYGLTLVYGNNPDLAASSRAGAALTIPTYEASGQAIHPDVLDFGSGNTWNGSRYWMAMTPCPSSDQSKENPSIVVSSDGTTWTEPVGITNPLDAQPAGGAFNSDPDLVMSPDGLTMNLIYREFKTSTYETLKHRSSTNGTTWSAESDLITINGSNATALLSPAVVWDGAQYVMWVVNATGSPAVVQRYTATDITGTWSSATTCTLVASNGTVMGGNGVWHINVVLDSGVYYMLITDNVRLWFAVSDDGITWQVSRSQLLAPSGTAWDDTWLYRAAIVRTGSGFDMWYSAKAATGAWGTGKTTITGL